MPAHRYHDLWDGFPTFDRLVRGFYRSASAKFDRDAVQRFHVALEYQILNIRESLIAETYKWGEYRRFWVMDPKLRLIESAPFRDRIVHQALVEVLDPVIDPTLYYHSYACRSGRGTHAAVRQLQTWVGNRPQWHFLQMDVTKFFPSIDRETLFKLVQQKIADEKMLRLIQALLFSAPGNNGIPIGNLTSQLFANLYLNPLDQYIKRELKIPFYLRYMDDIVLLAKDQTFLNQARLQVEAFAREKLKLSFHPSKIACGKVSDGISFVGYRSFPSGIYMRSKSVRRFRKKFKTKVPLDEKVRRYLSYQGHLRHAKDGEKILREFRIKAFSEYNSDLPE